MPNQRINVSMFVMEALKLKSFCLIFHFIEIKMYTHGIICLNKFQVIKTQIIIHIIVFPVDCRLSTVCVYVSKWGLNVCTCLVYTHAWRTEYIYKFVYFVKSWWIFLSFYICSTIVCFSPLIHLFIATNKKVSEADRM